jgi:hypothetical protein
MTPNFQDVIDALARFAFNLMLLALPIVAAYVAHGVAKFLAAKTAEAVQALKDTGHVDAAYALEKYARLAVKAAEQFIKGPGSVKKTYAVGILQRMLNERGITQFSVKTLADLVEAAVIEEFPHDQPANTGPLPPLSGA